ncbi:MAG: folylpolyglutamate synthase/dihydrofolate synthase family protein [Pseudomonadota bacterium]
MRDLEATLAALAERRPKLIDLGLSRVERTLDKLGRPHDALPPVFHVAGTNGKGSTVAFLRAILEASGARTHVYTSPHLVRFNERIVLAGDEVRDETLIDLLQRVDAAAGDDPLSFFETATCAAFLGFAETPADYVVVETGLGGRLDATNVLARPAACAITPVALDHQGYLGETLGEIAGEKAGIVKPGSPVAVGPQTPEAMAVLADRAAAVGAPARLYGVDWTARFEHGRFVYQDDRGLSDLTPPRLSGAHQAMNAGLAIAALRAAGVNFDDAVLSAGLARARWPARLQRLVAGPFVEAMAQAAAAGSELWLDGGHNPHAARAVAATLSEFQDKAPAKLVLIAGLQNAKDARNFFAAFDGIAASVFAVRSANPNASSADDVAAAAEAAGLPAHPCASVDEALALALGSGGERLRVLICGSLYLAGELLAEHR